MRNAFVIILLAIPCLLVGTTVVVCPSAAQSPTDDIPPSPVRDLGKVRGDAPTYPRGFFIPAYFNLDQSALEILNQKFDAIIVGRGSDYSGLVPEKLILVTGPSPTYSNSKGRIDEWSTIDAHEDWFLHSSADISSVTRIPLYRYPHLFYMDVGSQGWRDFVASKYLEVAASNPGADGVFVDGVPHPSEYESLLGTAHPSYDFSIYQGHAMDCIYQIRDAVPGKLLILNTELYEPFTLAGDGGVAEGFVHFGGKTSEEQITKARWLQNIGLIADRDLDGEFLLVGSGSIDSTLSSLVEYCYASFLLGYNAHARCYFYWHSNADGGYSKINWFPVWEMNIGEPVGDYFEAAGVYRRDFTGGTVVVNPSDSGLPITVNLGTVHTDSAGNSVLTVTLPNKSGAVLKKRFW